jgi:hypothetical protein
MLILSNLDVSPLLPRPLRIFSTQEKALEHLRNHVLTPPESYCWSLVVPAFRSLFDAQQTREVNQLARRLLSSPLPQEAQPLYDGYADAIRGAIRDAVAKGWYWQEIEVSGPPTWHGVGKSGVYVVWDQNVVRTAFFKLDDGDSSNRRGKEGRRNQGPLPRKRSTSNKLVGIPEDTPLARFQIFEKSWDTVRLAYGRACLQQRRIAESGQMDRWRNRTIPFQEWIAL